MVKNKTKSLILFILCFLISFTCFPINCNASSAYTKKVRVGYYENEVFENGASDNAVKSGYAYEYYRKLSEYTGWEYEYVYGDFSEIYQMLLKGEVDFVAGLAYTSERSNIILFPEKAMGSEKYSFVKHDFDKDITIDPRSFNGKTIGVLDSAIYDILNNYISNHRINAKIITYTDYSTLLNAFDKKQIDILAAENDGIYDRRHAEYLFSFGESDYYIGVCPGKPYLLKELNDAQEQLFFEEPNYVATLRNKYYPVTLSSRAYSKVEKDWINSHQTITVGYLNNYLPYSGTDKDGHVTGMICELVPALFKELNIPDIVVRYVGYDSYDELIKGLTSDEVDIAFPVGGGLYYSEEDGIYLSNPLVSSLTDLIYRVDFLGTPVSDFAVNKNNKMQYYYVKTHFPEASISYYSSIEECLNAVVKGEVSFTTLNGIRTNTFLKKNDYRNLSFRQLSFSDDRCIGVKIGNEGLLKLINRGIHVIGDEYIQNLSYRYMDAMSAYTFKDFINDHFFGVFIIIVVLLSAIIALSVRDINRTRRRIKEKESEKLDIQKTSSEKTNFLSNYSENLRFYINATEGLVDLIKHSNSKEETIVFVDRIDICAKCLSNIVNDVLDLSRIESGQVLLENTPVNIYEIIKDVRTVTSESMEEKKHIISVNYRNIKHPDVLTDRIRLTQVLINILTNAIEYTPAEGLLVMNVEEITSYDPEKARFMFQIKDNGPGMSMDIINSIFDPYAKERANFKNFHTIGFGLAICKKIVDMMEGTIDVFSIEGKGSEFTVEVPLLINTESKARSNENEAEIDSYNFSGKRVLVLEDSLPNQLFVSKIMKKVGFEIQIALDEFEAYEKIKAAHSDYFDLVLMNSDVYNNGDNELSKRLKMIDDPAKADTPIIPFTNDTPSLMKNISELLNT